MTKTKKLPRSIPRPFEIVLSIFGLMVAAPVICAAAILIRMDSRGPVFFRQQRVGLNGIPFTLFKLRTMRQTAKGPMITASDDDRVTRAGSFLRRTKVDELPEFWNVLLGHMSFVGPRPEVPELVDLTEPAWIEILGHKPGITDPVTLRLRNEEHLLAQVVDKERYYREVIQPYKLRGYLNFIRHKSWKTDIRIIGRTCRAVLFPTTVKAPSKDELQFSFAE
jgi:lipopolysaccharide/colanic/teichoic acid biosynthesis glycosyltransferase